MTVSEVAPTAITTTLIGGDDSEKNVFATSYYDDLSILFCFPLNSDRPESVNSRIVACFHDKEVEDPGRSYPSRAEMRKELKASIAAIWQSCACHPSIQLPDVVVQVVEEVHGKMDFIINPYTNSYQEYAEKLCWSEDAKKAMGSSLGTQSSKMASVSVDSLRFYDVLGGRGDTTLVRCVNDPKPQAFYVFKGSTFRSFLEDEGNFTNEEEAFYRELKVISSLPPHRHIIPPPKFLVTATYPYIDTAGVPRRSFVCGALYPYLADGSLQDALGRSNISGKRIPPNTKATWAYQIISALATTHDASQYHMDLKPDNILLDADDNAVLIDWEQTGASRFFIAPEADGLMDVVHPKRETAGEGQGEGAHQQSAKSENVPEFEYQRYYGPARTNNWAWPKWNVFPLWQKQCPAALQAAEVYSLGRTLWVMFTQMDPDDLPEDGISGDEASRKPGPNPWSSQCGDIPVEWKHFVDRCCDLRPHSRPTLADAVSFWKMAKIVQ